MITLAIDIGGSKGVVGLISQDGSILSKRRFLWNELSKDKIVAKILQESQTLLTENPDLVPTVAGAVIPGLADPDKGIWIEASFSGIRDFPVATILSDALKLPVWIDNDGQACALAEKFYGAGREVADFLYLTVSNGIGGSVFSGGRLISGANGMAGEFGHCTVVQNGRPCKCGLNGCLEMYAAGPAIARNYTELGGDSLPDGKRPDAAEIARRAQAGEETARDVFRLEGHYLGTVIAAACNILNPALVIIGGGVSQAFSLFESAMLETINQHMYRNANPYVQIKPTCLGDDGGLLGAAAVSFMGTDSERL